MKRLILSLLAVLQLLLAPSQAWASPPVPVAALASAAADLDHVDAPADLSADVRAQRAGWSVHADASDALRRVSYFTLPLTGAGKGAPGGSSGIAAPFVSVNGPTDGPSGAAIAYSYEGWSVQYSGTPSISSPVAFTVDRPGFTTAAATTTYQDTLYVTSRVREAWAAAGWTSTTYTPNTASLSDYVYSTDTVTGGITNSSSLISPKPVCNWRWLARGVIGNTISTDDNPVEAVCFHRNGRSGQQIAAFVFKISDGTNTVSVTVSTPTLSVRTTDKTSVIVYRLPPTSIASLNTGLAKVDGEAYPWIGQDNATPALSSVAKSAVDGNAERGFSTRYFRKDASFTQYYAVVAKVADAGDGVGTPTSSCAISTDLATAKATPCDLWVSAMNRAQTVIGGGANGVDGLIIYFDDGAHDLATAPTSNMTQKIACVNMARLPTSTNRASVVLNVSGANINAKLGTSGTSLTSPLTEGCLRYYDVAIKRTGAQPLPTGNATAGLQIQFDDVNYDGNAQNGALLSSSHLYIMGATAAGSETFNFGGATTGEMRLVAGLDIDFNSARTIENWFITGSIIRRPGGNGLASFTSRVASGLIFAFNKVLSPGSTTLWQINGGDAVGIVNAQNLYEWTTTSAGHSYSMSNDSATYSTRHALILNNTYVGWKDMGRENLFYDEGTTSRFNGLMASVGNIHVGIYHKGDFFRGSTNQGGTGAADANTRRGNFAYLFGVGSRYEFQQFMSTSALNGNEAQVYPGLGVTIGTTWNNTSQTSRIVGKNVLFVDYKGTESAFEASGGSPTTASAGVGGGDYRLPVGSPARAIVTDPVLNYTLDGVARPAANDNAGALAAVG